MIWIIIAALALVLSACIYQIRELTKQMHECMDIVTRTIRLVESINGTVKDTAESSVIIAGRVSNNEHRIRDIYKVINQMKGWPTHEVEYRS